MAGTVVDLAYLVAAVLFILGLRDLGHPRTAVRGNTMSALGMLLAIIVTLVYQGIVDWVTILAGLVVGAAVGVFLATRVEMTSMPQLVALFNGFGGGASVLVAGAALLEALAVGTAVSLETGVATVASGLIGAVTFWGSLVAFGKLQGILNQRAVLFRGRHVLNVILLVVSLALGGVLVMSPDATWAYWGLVAAASILGVTLVVPIGGADMPVVIALLNSYSGLAAAATGFVLSNTVLIISGSLVGASGIILSSIMSKAMNRSLPSILFGGLGASGGPSGEEMEDIYEGRIKSTSPEEVAMLLDTARRVVIVPGYGLAVAQAQHAVHDLQRVLEERGIEVEYAIHPVAGRMPGHMNVLLAEADVPYDKLKEMDAINPSFKETDLVLVIGANDVVNPRAREDQDPSNPIAGMPILAVDQAHTVIVVKRSLSPGFSGIPNPLFAADNTLMLFGDGKKMVLDLTHAIKES